MPRFGFVGPSYASASPVVAADVCINFYPEIVEQSPYKTRVALYPTPGLKLFASLGTGDKPVRGLFAVNNRVFAVQATALWEIASDGTKTNRGTVVDDNLPASMASSPSQTANELLVASGGRLYALDLSTNVFTAVPTATISDVSRVAYIDGNFLALIKNTARFRISDLLAATSWPGNQISEVSVFPDNAVSFIADKRELWVFGITKTVAYFSSGSFQIFDLIPGGFAEVGCAAVHSPVMLDRAHWLGQDERGHRIAYRANGYSPERISNHAVEFAWGQYSRVDDAISYAYQEQGHPFWVLYFPSAPNGGKTWVFDASTSLWHERAYLRMGVLEAHRSRCHAFAFGKHLVGDRFTGNIYEMSTALLDDDGDPIRRVRRAPHVSAELKRVVHNQMQVDVEAGVGPMPPLLDGEGKARDPQLMLRWSDDSARTWSNEKVVGFGQAGQYKTRAIFRRLGLSRDRIYEVSCSDPVKVAIADAFLEITPGYGA